MRSPASTDPKRSILQVRVHAGTAQVDFEADRQPPAEAPTGDNLITMVKETVKRVSKNEKMKLVPFLSLI